MSRTKHWRTASGVKFHLIAECPGPQKSKLLVLKPNFFVLPPLNRDRVRLSVAVRRGQYINLGWLVGVGVRDGF